MNYIPGFSNYLQASVPRYAKGGPARFADEDVMYLGDAAPIMDTPREAAVMPMTQEVAPYDMGGLGGLDFNGLYGGYDRGQYTSPAQPIMQQPATPYAEPYQPLPTAQPMTREAVPAAAPYAAPYQPLPAVQPMTQEAAPFDLSSLAGLDLSGLGGFGGGRMGGVIQDPNIQYITAPVSNKGNPTGKMGGNVFAVTPEQPVRLVDLNTNTIVFEGTGADAARKATEVGQNLTNTMGRKASYDIQTADPSGAYTTVANEKKNKSTLGALGQIVGTALPIVVSLVPGLQFAGPVLSAAIAGGAGAAMAGRDPVKGAIMGGLSAGGGQVLSSAKLLGPAFTTATGLGTRAAGAIGSGLGATAGGLATGQSLKSSLLGGVASGAMSYAGPTIQSGLGINPIPGGSLFTGSTPSVGADGYTGLTVTGGGTTSSPNFTLGGSQNKIQRALSQGTEAPFDGITAIGNRLGGLSAVNLGGNQFGAPGQDQSAFDRLTDNSDPNDILVKASRATQPSSFSLSPDVLAGLAEFEKNPIIAEASKIERPTSVSPDVLAGLAEFEKNPIVAEGSKIERPTTGALPADIVVNATTKTTPSAVTGGFTLSPDTVSDIDKKAAEEAEKKKKLGLEEYLRLAGLASGLIGGAAGGRRTGTYASGGGGLQNVFSARLPSASGIFSSKNLAPRDMSGTDFLRYGYGPEKSFFQNVPTNAGERDRLANEFRPSSLPLSAMYDPEALRQDALRQLAIGAPIEDVLNALLLNATPQEIEFYTKTPKGQQALAQLLGGSPNSGTSNPSMYVPDDMRFAEGGAFAAKRGGRSRRTEFAVNGAGTGRSDDIPAVLSDGEYVIDAETVALLGDGSNKAGAKKLDELRVKVRKHKGQKLAKGRFSANAKNPEAYLSGGRV